MSVAAVISYLHRRDNNHILDVKDVQKKKIDSFPTITAKTVSQELKKYIEIRNTKCSNDWITDNMIYYFLFSVMWSIIVVSFLWNSIGFLGIPLWFIFLFIYIFQSDSIYRGSLEDFSLLLRTLDLYKEKNIALSYYLKKVEVILKEEKYEKIETNTVKFDEIDQKIKELYYLFILSLDPDLTWRECDNLSEERSDIEKTLSWIRGKLEESSI